MQTPSRRASDRQAYDALDNRPEYRQALENLHAARSALSAQLPSEDAGVLLQALRDEVGLLARKGFLEKTHGQQLNEPPLPPEIVGSILARMAEPDDTRESRAKAFASVAQASTAMRGQVSQALEDADPALSRHMSRASLTRHPSPANLLQVVRDMPHVELPISGRDPLSMLDALRRLSPADLSRSKSIAIEVPFNGLISSSAIPLPNDSTLRRALENLHRSGPADLRIKIDLLCGEYSGHFLGMAAQMAGATDSRLEEVKISGTTRGIQEAESALASALRRDNARLRSLQLDMPISAAGMEAFLQAATQAGNGLHTLWTPSSDPVPPLAVAQALRDDNNRLRRLAVKIDGSNGGTMDLGTALGQAHSRIEHLSADFREIRLQNGEAQRLGQGAAQAGRLRSLVVSNLSRGDGAAFVRGLAPLLAQGRPQFHTLGISDAPRLGMASAELASALGAPGMPLRRLSLNRCDLDSESIVALARAASQPDCALRELDLRENFSTTFPMHSLLPRDLARVDELARSKPGLRILVDRD